MTSKTLIKEKTNENRDVDAADLVSHNKSTLCVEVKFNQADTLLGETKGVQCEGGRRLWRAIFDISVLSDQSLIH